MILANLIAGWHRSGAGPLADAGVMHPDDFMRLCQEARILPVTGQALFEVAGRPMAFLPLRHGTERGSTMFTTRARAASWQAS